MSLVAFVKVFGDLCFYFSLISVLPGLFSKDINWMGPILMAAFGVAAASAMHEWAVARGKKAVLRYIAVLIPLAIFTLAGSAVDVLILAPAVVYTILVIRGGIYSLEYFAYRSMFQITMILWGIVFIICFLIQSISNPLGHVVLFDYERMMLYGMIYVISAVFLLRQLRMGLTTSWKRSVLNGGELLTVGAMAAAVCLVVLGIGAGYLYFRGPINKFFSGILSVLTFAPVMVQQVLSKEILEMDWAALSEAVAEVQKENLEAGAPAPLGPIENLFGQLVGNNAFVAREEGFPWWLAVLIIGALVWILWKMLSVYMKANPVAVRTTVSGTTEIIRPSRKERRSPREKVRRCYRDFLKVMERKGFRREDYHTSEDILQAACERVSPEAAAALRQIYISARYDESAVITEEQYRQAQKALKKLKELKEQREQK